MHLAEPLEWLPQETIVFDGALAVAERRGIALRMLRAASAHGEVRDESMKLLATLGLAEDANQRILDLPYGRQRLVEIAIALGLKPRVLLLDEPAAGVGEVLVEGPPEEIAKDRRVYQVYLGEQKHA